VLAVALPPAARLRRRMSDPALGAAGFAVFALAGALSALPQGIEAMLSFRALQAAGAAAALVAAFALLRGSRLWTGAAVFGTAVGPALGGALTQAFDWRAIFVFQVPVALAAVAACVASRGAAPAPAPEPPAPAATLASGRAGALFALAALSAALTGVLFLLVLLLVSGWSLEPMAAAVAVSVLPVAALAGSRIRGPAGLRAAAGCGLVAGGVLSLAVLPGFSAGWIVMPQVLAGLGMGMALPALAGDLLPQRTPEHAAGLLSIRHAGITVALVILAPVAAAQLDGAVSDVREQGAALMLDARLPPVEKLQLAGPLVADLDTVDPRAGLRRALDEQAPRFAGDPQQRREYARLTERADDALLRGVDSAFRVAFLIAGGLALAGAAAVAPRDPRARRLALGAAVVALTLPAIHLALRPAIAPEAVTIADPCKPRALPKTGGIDGFVQDAALLALDSAACHNGSSREELALALADADAARAYREAHGVDPSAPGGLLGLLGIKLG
jgi:Major Facilitator Superfamily